MLLKCRREATKRKDGGIRFEISPAASLAASPLELDGKRTKTEVLLCRVNYKPSLHELSNAILLLQFCGLTFYMLIEEDN